jgi:hypothetical protein
MVFDILADGVRFELYSPAAAKADPDHFALTRRTPLNDRGLILLPHNLGHSASRRMISPDQRGRMSPTYPNDTLRDLSMFMCSSC